MAKKYVIEIGIDGNVAARNDGTYPHLMSVAEVMDWPPEKPSQNATPSWFTNFQREDEFVFRVCDYTEGASQPSKLDVQSLYVVFLDPKKPSYLAPSLNENFVVTGQRYFPEQGWPSVVISGAPGWRFTSDGKNESILWFGDVFKGVTRALLRVSVAATYPVPDPKANTILKEFRWYTHDPEIIVGVGGPPTYSRPKSLKRR